ncbi:MAG: hypothetical protein ABW042_11200 [Phenylobacterium sp.]
MRRWVLGALLLALAACSDGGGEATAQAGPQEGPQTLAQSTAQGGPQQAAADQAQQALQGLYAIRQQQCQSGNTLACQSLGQFPGHSQKLAQSGQACRTGDQRACEAYNGLSQTILKAYAESAQVMQAGAQSAAQMDAWRAQMNANHAGNMARLDAQAAAGQAAHQARQESYAAMNQSWANGQAAGERNTGRFVDTMREGTTVDGGGVQTFVPHGSTAYTDGSGNVVVGREGGEPPAGWQQMNPTYAAPD